MDELQKAAQAYSDARTMYNEVKAYVDAIPDGIELDLSIHWNFGGSMHGFSETRRLVEKAHSGAKAREMINAAVDDAQVIMLQRQQELIAIALGFSRP